MLFAELVHKLTDRGLRVVRPDEDRLRCLGDPSGLTPELQQGLKEHRDVFLSLLPSPADRCRQIVSDAVDQANALCPPSWVPTERQWAVMDESQDKLHDAARAADIEWTKASAAEYVRVCETCFLTESLHAWRPGSEQLHFCGSFPERWEHVTQCEKCGYGASTDRVSEHD